MQKAVLLRTLHRKRIYLLTQPKKIQVHYIFLLKKKKLVWHVEWEKTHLTIPLQTFSPVTDRPPRAFQMQTIFLRWACYLRRRLMPFWGAVSLIWSRLLSKRWEPKRILTHRITARPGQPCQIQVTQRRTAPCCSVHEVRSLHGQRFTGTYTSYVTVFVLGNLCVSWW